MTYPTLTTVPKELYYHEVAYVRRLESDKADLLRALKETLQQAEGCWANHYGDNPEGSPVPHHIAQSRAAIAKAESA